MTDTKVRELLEQLHEELAHTESVDGTGRALLQGISGDISSLLERSEPRVDESLLEKLQETIDHLEITHPKLTMALSEMMTILSNAGI